MLKLMFCFFVSFVQSLMLMVTAKCRCRFPLYGLWWKVVGRSNSSQHWLYGCIFFFCSSVDKLLTLQFAWLLGSFSHSCPRFRRQHEQLRQVIIRVLRPSTKGRTGTPGAEEQDLKTEPVVDEAADANAIEVGLIVVFVYTEHVLRRQQFHLAPAMYQQHFKYTTLVDL